MSPTKTCERCGTTYPASETYFDLNLRYKDRLKPYCRRCSPAVAEERRQRKNARSRAWAQANRDKARASTRESYQRTRKDRLTYLRRYRAANQERLRQYARAYRERQRRERVANANEKQ